MLEDDERDGLQRRFKDGERRITKLEEDVESLKLAFRAMDRELATVNPRRRNK